MNLKKMRDKRGKRWNSKRYKQGILWNSRREEGETKKEEKVRKGHPMIGCPFWYWKKNKIR